MKTLTILALILVAVGARADVIAIHVMSERPQRLYVADVKDGKIKSSKVWLTSSQANHKKMSTYGLCTPETPVGNFTVKRLVKVYRSKRYDATMRYCVFFEAGVAVHATLPSHYAMLGRPDSGGCIRLRREQAKYFYDRVTKARAWGEPVSIIVAKQVKDLTRDQLGIISQVKLAQNKKSPVSKPLPKVVVTENKAKPPPPPIKVVITE